MTGPVEGADRTARPGSRRMLLSGVAVAAVLAGAGVAWWRSRGDVEEATGDADRLWSLRLASPSGSELALADFRGKPLLVNFWATWCPPCVEELPLLDRFYRERQAAGWQVLGLAIDQPSAVRGFLQKTPVSFPVALAGLEGTQLTRDLGNTAGGLPFTVVVRRDGRLMERRMGRVTEADLQAWSARA